MKKTKPITILTYHSIGPDGYKQREIGENLYRIGLEDFQEQMSYLNKCNFKVITCQEVLSRSDNQSSAARSVILTFDDGDISNYKIVYPILRELGFLAYFFIIVERIGEKDYMNWEQIKELRDSRMIIGSHGMTHRILSELTQDQLEFELKVSKKILEDNLGLSIDYLSIPRGIATKEIIGQAKLSGYKTVFTSQVGRVDLFSVSFELRRISVKRDWGLTKFEHIVNNGSLVKENTQEFFKNSARKILGIKAYDGIRSKILRKS